MAGLEGKTALITGGAGFIGSHLVKLLAEIGLNVVVLDISIYPLSFFITEKLYNRSKFELVDVTSLPDVDKIFKKHSPDFVFHLAAEPIVEKAYESPYSTFKTNIMGTISILEAARKNKKIKGILFTSSDKAYGKTKKTYTEDFPLQGDHPYDVSKSSSDLIAQAYFKTYGLPIVITRFGNVYGEGDVHLNRIIPGICEAVIKNKRLEIRSNGKYVRDYVYVKDIARGCILLIEKINQTRGEAYNFSSKDNLSVLEVVKKAEKSLDTKIKYIIKNTARNEIPYQHLNDAKVRKLGWENTHSLSDILPQTSEWYRKTLV